MPVDLARVVDLGQRRIRLDRSREVRPVDALDTRLQDRVGVAWPWSSRPSTRCGISASPRSRAAPQASAWQRRGASLNGNGSAYAPGSVPVPMSGSSRIADLGRAGRPGRARPAPSTRRCSRASRRTGSGGHTGRRSPSWKVPRIESPCAVTRRRFAIPVCGVGPSRCRSPVVDAFTMVTPSLPAGMAPSPAPILGYTPSCRGIPISSVPGAVGVAGAARTVTPRAARPRAACDASIHPSGRSTPSRAGARAGRRALAACGRAGRRNRTRTALYLSVRGFGPAHAARCASVTTNRRSRP